MWGKKKSASAGAKLKVAKLVQSPRDQAIIVDLQADESAIITGVMGGCCSIVMMWGLDINGGGYLNVRGHHAGGGPGNLDWDTLLHGFTNTANDRMVMACAPTDYEGTYSYVDKVKTALRERGVLCRRTFAAHSNAFVGRDGATRSYSDTENGQYQIRNQNSRAII